MANSSAHGDKRAEVAAEAFVCFFIQTSEGAEATPVKLRLLSLHKTRLPFDLFHTKRGHDTVEITLFSAGPSKNTGFQVLKQRSGSVWCRVQLGPT